MPIKNRQQLLTILTLTAVGLLAVDRVISPPLTKLWGDRSKEIAALKKQVTEGQQMQRRKESLHSRWDEIQKSALPNDPTAAEHEFNNGLYNWLQFSDVSIQGISPTWKQGDGPEYKTLECRVDTSGSIDRLSRFLYALETDPMALRVQSIEMSSKDNNGLVINLGVQISALVLTAAEPKK